MKGRRTSQFISALLWLFVTMSGASTHSEVSHLATSDQEQPPVKRRFVVIKSPANAVVAIEAVRYLEEDDWYERFEVQVKNISNKPIYFLEVVIMFPDVVSYEVDGARRTLVLPFTFGSSDFMRKGNRAKPDDASIAPGESHVFKVPSQYSEMRQQLDVVRRIGIRVYSVSFGDETGFKAGSIGFSFNQR